MGEEQAGTEARLTGKIQGAFSGAGVSARLRTYLLYATLSRMSTSNPEVKPASQAENIGIISNDSQEGRAMNQVFHRPVVR